MIATVAGQLITSLRRQRISGTIMGNGIRHGWDVGVLAAPARWRRAARLPCGPRHGRRYQPLQVRLEAAQGSVRVAGRAATALAYNGGLPGPPLHLQPGDRLRVQLANRLDAPTNLHVHCLHVSPEGNGDNAFVTLGPGETFDYDYQLPDDHPPGVYWYHPHLHGMVAEQVFGGLCGAIIVADTQELPVTRERVLVISDITFDGDGRIPPASSTARMMGREGDPCPR